MASAADTAANFGYSIKVCKVCEATKPRTEFHANKATRDRLDPRCKQCTSARAKARRASRELPPVSGAKVCTRCDRQLPVDDFYRNRGTRDGLASWCKSCLRAKSLIYGRSKILDVDFNGADADAMWTAQQGRCAICQRPESEFKRSLHLDHCHATGRVRGLLCSGCNTAIGLMGDDTDRLLAAVQYLKEARNA